MASSASAQRAAHRDLFFRMVSLPNAARRRAFMQRVRVDAVSRARLRRSLEDFETKRGAYLDMHLRLARQLGRTHVDEISVPWLRDAVRRRLDRDAAGAG